MSPALRVTRFIWFSDPILPGGMLQLLGVTVVDCTLDLVGKRLVAKLMEEADPPLRCPPAVDRNLAFYRLSVSSSCP